MSRLCLERLFGQRKHLKVALSDPPQCMQMGDSSEAGVLDRLMILVTSSSARVCFRAMLNTRSLSANKARKMMVKKHETKIMGCLRSSLSSGVFI